MPYETPTAAMFKTRYPEFVPVADARVDVFIGEALHLVDNTWVEFDYQPAVMALTAHRLSMEGEPGIANGTSTDVINANRRVKRRKVHDVESEFDDNSNPVSAADQRSSFLIDLSMTPYGRRFAQLLRLNVTTIMAV